MRMLGKRGQVLNGLSVGISVIASIAITVVLLLYVFSQIADEMDDNSAAQNATNNFITKFAKIPTWIGLLLIVLLIGAVMYIWKVNQ
jgi:type II secretory pathway component PulF